MNNFRLLQRAFRPIMTNLASKGEKLFSPKLLLYTNTGLCVGLSITGDILQQVYQAKTKRKTSGSWDRVRTLRMAGTGLVMGPVVHYWYIFLDRIYPGRTLRILFKKIALDQLICSPVYLSLFLLTMGAMERKQWPEIRKDFEEKGSVLYVAECCVWPPAQLVNFLYLPTKYRVLYDNTLSLAFDVFWSYVWYEMGLEHSDNETENDSDTIVEDEV